jgi:hypothetical protein
MSSFIGKKIMSKLLTQLLLIQADLIRHSLDKYDILPPLQYISKNSFSIFIV